MSEFNRDKEGFVATPGDGPRENYTKLEDEAPYANSINFHSARINDTAEPKFTGEEFEGDDVAILKSKGKEMKKSITKVQPQEEEQKRSLNIANLPEVMMRSSGSVRGDTFGIQKNSAYRNEESQHNKSESRMSQYPDEDDEMSNQSEYDDEDDNNQNASVNIGTNPDNGQIDGVGEDDHEGEDIQ